MRCPDCSKMVSFDTDMEPEEQDAVEVGSDGTITAGSYRRMLGCAECGTELKESTLEINGQQLEVPEKCKDGEEHDWEVEDASVSATERTQSKDRNGKPIKSARYAKRFYGIEVQVKAKCAHCEAVAEGTFSADEQASSFEELV